MPLRQFFICILMSLSMGAAAQEVKTTYQITGSGATVSTVIKKGSSEQEKLLTGYIFETLAKKIKQFPQVTGLEYDRDVKEEKTTTSYSDYWEIKRKYPVMIHLVLPTSVTLMLKVEETYRRCKTAGEKPQQVSQSRDGYGDYEGLGTSSGECMLNSSAKVTGPFAVYGNFASSLDVDKLLRERQTISIEASKDWADKASIKLESRFAIESELFDNGLQRFLEAFNVKLQSNGGSGMSRNNILVGIARILRVNNERMVEL